MQYVLLCCDLQIHLLLVWPWIFRSPCVCVCMCVCVCVFWRINSDLFAPVSHTVLGHTNMGITGYNRA